MPTAAPAEDWLTAAQVAAYFQVNPRTVYRWAASDPTMRVKRLGPNGRTVRIHRSELERDHNGPATTRHRPHSPAPGPRPASSPRPSATGPGTRSRAPPATKAQTRTRL
ncbi:helix-turn-helix domain-containing protein [Streptomyces sp. CL12-4]|uniref:helix-turn-helix domain-containing protein n=1 Tax=Streptomyces sp. CL12-4 TaxID=2810306 RepID=UPI001EFB892C|nr:helix-turn-helix domain-containing protein [Streptomyces sp. CL12-4]